MQACVSHFVTVKRGDKKSVWFSVGHFLESGKIFVISHGSEAHRAGVVDGELESYKGVQGNARGKSCI